MWDVPCRVQEKTYLDLKDKYNCQICIAPYLIKANSHSVQFSSVQFSCSVGSDSLWPHELQHARPPWPSPTPGVHSHVHRVTDAIQPSHPLSSSSPPAPNPSQHQSLFQWVNSSHEVAKVLEFQLFSIIPSKEHPGLISFRMEWLDLLAVHGAYRLLLNIEYNSLCYIVGPCWLSILQIVVCIC